MLEIINPADAPQSKRSLEIRKQRVQARIACISLAFLIGAIVLVALLKLETTNSPTIIKFRQSQLETSQSEMLILESITILRKSVNRDYIVRIPSAVQMVSCEAHGSDLCELMRRQTTSFSLISRRFWPFVFGAHGDEAIDYEILCLGTAGILPDCSHRIADISSWLRHSFWRIHVNFAQKNESSLRGARRVVGPIENERMHNQDQSSYDANEYQRSRESRNRLSVSEHTLLNFEVFLLVLVWGSGGALMAKAFELMGLGLIPPGRLALLITLSLSLAILGACLLWIAFFDPKVSVHLAHSVKAYFAARSPGA